MPSKTPAQARLMRAVAHGWHKPGGGGPSVSVAKEFTAADKGKKFGQGGSVNSFKRGGKVRKKPAGISPAMLVALSQPPPGAPPGPMSAGPGGPPGMGMKKGGEIKNTKTENKGGQSKIGGGIENKASTSTKLIKMKGAGIASKGLAPTRNYAKGGSVRGHGIESSGRTRGRFT